MGTHALKFGFSYNRYTKNQQLFGDEQRAVHLQRQQRQQIHGGGLGGLPGEQNGCAAACRASRHGHVSWPGRQLQAAGAQPIRHYVSQTPSVYAMDDWRVDPEAVACNSECATTRCRRHGSVTTRWRTSTRQPTPAGSGPSGPLRARCAPAGPGFVNVTVDGLALQLRERDGISPVGRLSPWPGDQRLQDVAASYGVLGRCVRGWEDGSAWRIRNVLRAHAGQRDLQRCNRFAVLVPPGPQNQVYFSGPGTTGRPEPACCQGLPLFATSRNQPGAKLPRSRSGGVFTGNSA